MTASMANGFGHILYTPGVGHVPARRRTRSTPSTRPPTRAATRGRRTRTTSRCRTRSGTSRTASSSTPTFNCVDAGRPGLRCSTRTTATTSASPARTPRWSTSTAASAPTRTGTDSPTATTGRAPIPNVVAGPRLHPSPVLFTSPLANGRTNYSTIAFETDLPRIEAADAQDNPPFCDRTTGRELREPAERRAVLPVLHDRRSTTARAPGRRAATSSPARRNHFGGSSTTEYGPLLKTVYPEPGFTTVRCFNNFNSGDRANPCPAG